jgi:hypothetical protein
MLRVIADYTVLFKIVQVMTRVVLQNVIEPQLTSSFINLFSIAVFNFITIVIIKSSDYDARHLASVCRSHKTE